MSYYRTCSRCGAHLDPGEVCDCRDEKTLASAANTDGGRGEQNLTTVSTSNDTREKEDLQAWLVV